MDTTNLSSQKHLMLGQQHQPEDATAGGRKIVHYQEHAYLLFTKQQWQQQEITKQTHILDQQRELLDRFANHKTSFHPRSKHNSRELSNHIWQLKDLGNIFNSKRKILKSTSPYNVSSKRCSLCLWEKWLVICKLNLVTLNKRTELVNTCRHANKHLLRNST